MAYIATVQGQAFHIDTEQDEEQQSVRTVKLEDSALSIDWRHIAPLVADAKGSSTAGGHYSLIIDDISYDIFARRLQKTGEKDSQTYEIFVGDQRFEVVVENERTKLLSGLIKGAAGTSEATVQAPMPGLVIGVPAEQGATVEAGQTVIVLEAMKMENDLSSPITGTIKEVKVRTGQTVDQGEVLAIITAEQQP